MATCPTCLSHYADDVAVCEKDGDTLLPDHTIGVDPDLLAGVHVGEYVIEGKIGAGTFGSVYRAIQPLIGKQVAVKVLSRKYSADPHVVSRFIAEARAVNQIRNKNIIDIFSFGQLEDGRHYHVMELLDGQPLDEYVASRGGRLPLEELLPILRGLARALDAAHASGIAHRDLKPANVFLARDEDGTPFPKLLDFGIAKLLTDDLPRQHSTATGAAVGTPDYMSPEQCQGPDVDHRTDIYSFGIMTYQLLTGHLPFTGSSVVEVLMKQMTMEARPPSQVAPDVSTLVDAPVLAMIAKAPEARPPNTSLAVQALTDAAIEAGYAIPSGSHSGERDPRLVRSGPGLETTPNININPSSPGLAATLPSSSNEHLRAPEIPTARRGIPLWAGIAVMVVAVAIVPFLLDSSSSDAPPPPVAAAQTAAKPPPAAVPPPPAAALPQMVELTVQGAPDGAQILGPGDVRLGTAPVTLRLPRSESAMPLTFRAAGFEDLQREIVPVASGTIAVDMKPIRRRPPPAKRRPSKKKPGKDDLEVPSWD